MGGNDGCKICLALFKRLIDRIPSLVKYWWFVVAFNLAVTGYGASAYVIACPHFSGPKVSKSTQKSKQIK